VSASKAYLAVSPERCNGCGRCVRACPRSAIRVGGGYVYVDSSACDGCFACVETCDTGAIVRRAPVSSPVAVGSGPTVIVGSRAEAKALRQAAQVSARERTKATKVAEKRQRADRVKSEHVEAVSADGAATFELTDAAIVVAVMLGAFALKEFVLASEPFALIPDAGRSLARAGVLGVYYSLQAFVLVALARRRGMTVTRAFGLRGLDRTLGERLATAGWTLALLVATRLFATAWGAFAQAVGWEPPARGEITALFGSGGAGLLLTVVLVVVVGPVIEELAFRGVVMRAAGARFGMWPAILGSAGLFALFHLTPWLLVPTFALGTALGWLAWTRRSLAPSIVMHAAYNGIVVAAAFWLAS